MQFSIEPTKNTPYVNIDAEKGVMEVRGVSSPENALAFYEPVFEYLLSYTSTGSSSLLVEMAFIHFNTSSSKCLFDIFKHIKKLETKGVTIEVNWHYDEFDEDMREVGEDYADILDLEFSYHIMEEE